MRLGALDDTNYGRRSGMASSLHGLSATRARTLAAATAARRKRPAGLAPVELRGHKAEVTTVAFSNRGDRLLSGSRDGTARLWYWRGRLRSVAGVLLESPAAVAAVRRARGRGTRGRRPCV